MSLVHGTRLRWDFFIWVGTSYLFIFNSMVRWKYVTCTRFPASVSFLYLFSSFVFLVVFLSLASSSLFLTEIITGIPAKRVAGVSSIFTTF